MQKYLSLLLLGFLSVSCASLFHVQVGEIDADPGYVLKPFDIKISETGVDIQQAKNIGKAFMNKQDQHTADKIGGVIALFQMGPRTGYPVYVDNYAKNLIELLYEKCPSGKVTGLTSIREAREYPVVSGEIIKVTGYCMLPKES